MIPYGRHELRPEDRDAVLRIGTAGLGGEEDVCSHRPAPHTLYPAPRTLYRVPCTSFQITGFGSCTTQFSHYTTCIHFFPDCFGGVTCYGPRTIS